MSVLPTSIYAYWMCAWCQQRSEEGTRSLETGLNGQLPASMWMLGIEPSSSGRAAGASNHWTISPAPAWCFLKLFIRDTGKWSFSFEPYGKDYQTYRQYFNFIRCIHFMCVYFAFMYGCVPHACIVPSDIRRWQWIPWNWSYRWLWTICGCQRIEPRSSARASNALNHWALSLVHIGSILLFSYLDTY